MNALDYNDLISDKAAWQMDDLAAWLAEELLHLWAADYRSNIGRSTDLVRIKQATFEYLYECADWVEELKTIDRSIRPESRVIGVCGYSSPRPRLRDDNRLKGWVGATETYFGEKGHFIGHSLGGVVDGFEANVFRQLRALNRGWSDEGKVYRSMEKYCAAQPGAFCFSRPIYTDDSAHPSCLEFGVLRSPTDLWWKCFNNSIAA